MIPDKLISNPKLFAGGTSLFSTVRDPNKTANQINDDLHMGSPTEHEF